MILYLVRHGQSEGNKSGFHQKPETPLSASGIKQAKTLAERLRNVHFDLIYSGTSVRAKQTAEIINQKLNVPIEFWEDLMEFRTPTEIRGRKVDEPGVIKIKEFIKKNEMKGNWRYSDEETFDELTKRVERVLTHLEQKHKDQTILCVSHSTAMKAIVGKILFGKALAPQIFFRMRAHMYAENTGVTICERSEKYGWTLNTWNDTTHLR